MADESEIKKKEESTLFFDNSIKKNEESFFSNENSRYLEKKSKKSPAAIRELENLDISIISQKRDQEKNENLRRLEDCRNLKKKLKQKLEFLQEKITTLKSYLSSEPNTLQPGPTLKKHIQISDDKSAKIKALELVQKLKLDQKKQDLMKIKELEEINRNLLSNLEKIRNERTFFEETMKMGRREGSEEKILINKDLSARSLNSKKQELGEIQNKLKKSLEEEITKKDKVKNAANRILIKSIIPEKVNTASPNKEKTNI